MHDDGRGIVEFPACAGMNRELVYDLPKCVRFRVPRMRGDEPWLHQGSLPSRLACEFPACAGMNRYRRRIPPQQFTDYEFPACAGMNRIKSK